MNKLDFLVRYMPIYVNFIFGLLTILSLKRDFITLLILLFLNETIHSQFKNEMIPAFYIWVVPDKKNYFSDKNQINSEFIPSFHCQYIWFINSVLNHYINFYNIGDYFINNIVLLTIGMYVVFYKMNNGSTFVQCVLGMFLGILYGKVTTKYILHLDPVNF
jgi:hypothetical protein